MPTLTRTAHLHDYIARTEARLQRAERYLRITWTLAAVATLGALVMGQTPTAIAQGVVTPGSVETRLRALEQKTQYIVVRGTDMKIVGANVYVQNGDGATETENGVGNLTIGYNEARADGTDARDGSHNLILGSRNNYTGSGGAVFGMQNSISERMNSVLGGILNTASGSFNTILAGQFNKASAFGGSVSGGFSNTVAGNYGSVSGGEARTANGPMDWAAGGLSQDF
jgi:hypothetical protein